MYSSISNLINFTRYEQPLSEKNYYTLEQHVTGLGTRSYRLFAASITGRTRAYCWSENGELANIKYFCVPRK